MVQVILFLSDCWRWLTNKVTTPAAASAISTLGRPPLEPLWRAHLLGARMGGAGIHSVFAYNLATDFITMGQEASGRSFTSILASGRNGRNFMERPLFSGANPFMKFICSQALTSWEGDKTLPVACQRERVKTHCGGVYAARLARRIVAILPPKFPICDPQFPALWCPGA